jgi:hypothetical protein
LFQTHLMQFLWTCLSMYFYPRLCRNVFQNHGMNFFSNNLYILHIVLPNLYTCISNGHNRVVHFLSIHRFCTQSNQFTCQIHGEGYSG